MNAITQSSTGHNGGMNAKSPQALLQPARPKITAIGTPQIAITMMYTSQCQIDRLPMMRPPVQEKAYTIKLCGLDRSQW
jgi:hypothetical protein